MPTAIEVNGLPAISLTVHYPGHGVPTFVARVNKAKHKTINKSPLGLKIVYDNLTLIGTFMTSYEYQEGVEVRGVLGAGGWGKNAAAISYSDPAGVKASTVLLGLEKATGETFDAKPETRIGPHFIQPLGPASWALRQVVPQWYVGLDGKTRAGTWPASEVKKRFEIMSAEEALRAIVVAMDTTTEWLPGATFTHPRFASATIEAATHIILPNTYRVKATLKAQP